MSTELVASGASSATPAVATGVNIKSLGSDTFAERSNLVGLRVSQAVVALETVYKCVGDRIKLVEAPTGEDGKPVKIGDEAVLGLTPLEPTDVLAAGSWIIAITPDSAASGNAAPSAPLTGAGASAAHAGGAAAGGAGGGPASGAGHAATVVQYFFSYKNNKIAVHLPPLVFLSDSRIAPAGTMALGEAFNTTFGPEHYDTVFPKLKVGDSDFFDIPAGCNLLSGSHIVFIPRVHVYTAQLRTYGKPNARRLIAEYARQFHVRGEVSRVLRDIVDPLAGTVTPETELVLRLEAYNEDAIAQMLDRMSEDAYTAVEEERSTVHMDLTSRTFKVHASGPRRLDGEDSLDSSSEASFSVMSPSYSHQLLR